MSESLERINYAIDECLRRLEGAANSRQVLQSFIVECQEALAPEELRTVETAVFRVIEDREKRRK